MDITFIHGDEAVELMKISRTGKAEIVVDGLFLERNGKGLILFKSETPRLHVFLEEIIHAYQWKQGVKEVATWQGKNIDFHEYQAKRLLLRLRKILGFTDDDVFELEWTLKQVLEGKYNLNK